MVFFKNGGFADEMGTPKKMAVSPILKIVFSGSEVLHRPEPDTENRKIEKPKMATSQSFLCCRINPFFPTGQFMSPRLIILIKIIILKILIFDVLFFKVLL